MPWDGSAFAGFSSAEPWLPLNQDWPVRNVAAQDADAASMLTLYRRLLALRREHAALSLGDLLLVPAEDEVLQYERRHGARRLLVALNFGSRARPVLLPGGVTARLLMSTVVGRQYDGTLAPAEGTVLQLEGG
jgi:glycosidase